MEIDIQKDSNLNAALYDVLQGDSNLMESLGIYNQVEMDKILKAVDFITNNESLSSQEKADLLSNSWRLNYKVRPPSPEEFLSETYLGEANANSIYPRIKKTFLEFADPSSNHRNLVLYPMIGWGKEVLNSSKIMTPEGYKTIDAINIGDSVCNPDGGTSQVTGVFPQGKKELYKFTFSDGRTVVAGLEHQWKASKSTDNKVWDKVNKKFVQRDSYKRCWKIITTEGILKDLEQNPKLRWCIPLAKPVYHNPTTHTISPYVLGAFLGGGYLPKRGYLTLVGNDKEVFDRVISELGDNYGKSILLEKEKINYKITTSFRLHIHQSNTSIASEFTRLGLMGKLSPEKFIPKEYLFDSIENRWALLQGLMDTDGTAESIGDNIRNRISFSSSSEQLCDDIILLVRGLGGLASISFKDRRLTKPHTNSIEYRVFISFPNNDTPVFHLKRKQDSVDYRYNRKRTRTGTQFLFIKSIDKVEDDEATCIMVDHPEHLYLTDDYIVTHNSFLSVLWNLYTTTHLAMMRDAKKYFGLSPSVTLCQVFCSFNLKKSSEVLISPILNMLEKAEFFERLRTKDDMAKKEKEYLKSNQLEKLYWTTASRNGVSALQFSNGVNYKMAASPNAILGLAQPLNELIQLPNQDYTQMGNLKIGDKIASPSEGETTVIGIYPQGKLPCYNITLEDGRSVRCSPNHLWKVGYKKEKEGELIIDIVELQFILNHPNWEFFIFDKEDCILS